MLELTTRATAGLLKAKGAEYAGSADRLANFKRGAQLTGATPLQVAFIYASKHYDSLATYIRNDAKGLQQHLSEPIEGRFDDLINYCILMKALVMEADTTSTVLGVSSGVSGSGGESGQQATREFLSQEHGSVVADTSSQGGRRRWDNEDRQKELEERRFPDRAIPGGWL